MKATLWDGSKQIHGQLDFKHDRLVFDLDDFKDSSLHLEIKYNEIVNFHFKKIFDLVDGAIQINSITGEENVFLVENIYEVLGLLGGLTSVGSS